MKTGKHLDWLSITIPNAANWRNFIPFADLHLEGKGRHGYGQAWVDRRSGARIETASTRDDMGTHLTLSGDVLEYMRQELGAIDDKIIQRIEEFDGKCSRIDLALDIFGANFGPEHLNTALLDGSAKINARVWRYIDGHNSGVRGATIDTGSPKSDRRFRCYDKLAEQGIKDGEAWVRLELQLRRLYATGAVDLCLGAGVPATTSVSIGAYLTWSDTEYLAAIADRGTHLTSLPRRVSNRKKWLLGQVASALADECIIDPYFREKFNIAVNGFIQTKLDVSLKSDVS